MVGLAKVRKTPPRLTLGDVKPVADVKTLEAIVAHRYELMASYAREVRLACAAEMSRLQSERQQGAADKLARVRKWLHRDDDKVPQALRGELQTALVDHPKLGKLVAMREELRLVWTKTNVSADQLAHDLQAWCQQAENSGIQALKDFSLKLRAAHA
jgi:stearoyl-CoA desaturase (delta-9 desaturase)